MYLDLVSCEMLPKLKTDTPIHPLPLASAPTGPRA